MIVVIREIKVQTYVKGEWEVENGVAVEQNFAK